MIPASLPPMLPSRQDRRSRHRIGREPAEDRRDSPRAILPPKPPFRLPKTAAPLLDGEEAGKAVPYHPAVAFRECTGPANDQGLVEREELETDLARDVEPGLAPVPEHHVARPPARSRGDHGQDRLIVGLVEVCRRDGHGRPALRGQGRWQGRGTTISRQIGDHATLPCPRGKPSRSASPRDGADGRPGLISPRAAQDDRPRSRRGARHFTPGRPEGPRGCASPG